MSKSISNTKGAQEVRSLFRYFMAIMGLEKTQLPEGILIDIVIAAENTVAVNSEYDLMEEDAYNDILECGWVEGGILETSDGAEVLRCSVEFEASINAIKPLFERYGIEGGYFSDVGSIDMIFLKYKDGKARKMLTPIMFQFLYDEFLGQGREECKKRADSVRKFIEKGVDGTENGYTEGNSFTTDTYNSIHNILRSDSIGAK